MRTHWFILVPLLLASTVTAKTETADLGPFIADFDITDVASEHEIVINPPYQFDNYNEYYFRVDSTAEPFVDVYIDDYGTSVDVSDRKLMEVVENTYGTKNRDVKFDWKLSPSVGGQPAVFAKITHSDNRISYDAAYSPDGIGNRGSIIVYISSTYPESVTDKFLSKLMIKRA